MPAGPFVVDKQGDLIVCVLLHRLLPRSHTTDCEEAIIRETLEETGYRINKPLRLDQDSGWSGEDPVQRHRPRRLCLHLRRRGLQSRAIAEAPGGGWLMAKVPGPCDTDARHGERFMDNMHVLIDHELKRKGHLTEIDTPGGNFPAGQLPFGALQI